MAAKKKSRKVHLINKFIKIFVLTFALLVIVAALGTIGYVQVASSNIMKQLSNNPVTNGGQGESLDDVLGEDEASILNSKKITTLAIFGVDVDGYRTDVNMIAFFHHETGEIDIVSIPRDTKVQIPDAIFQEISETRSGVKQNTKINSIPAYVSADKRNEVSVSVIENVFGIDIDYYVNMDLNGFKNIVDAVGPIMVDVPMDMEYTDKAQNPPLIINLKKGLQPLNGAQAEQLIRFRYGYANADIGRIETQHAFMTAFMEKLLEPDKRINMIGILETVLVYINTDFTDATDYLIYLKDVSADKITMTTLPGAGSTYDGSYIYDVAGTKALFESIINKTYGDQLAETDGTEATVEETDDGTIGTNEETIIEVDPIVPIDVTAYTISVLNATKVSGLAGRTRDMLIDAGFNVKEVGNYETRPIERTIIKAPDREVGEILANYFDNPEVFVDENLEGADIQVIVAVGTDDSN